jgi:hypothetical protein
MTSHGADGNDVAGDPDARQFGDTAEIDEHRRPGQAQFHGLHETLTAGK